MKLKSLFESLSSMNEIRKPDFTRFDTYTARQSAETIVSPREYSAVAREWLDYIAKRKMDNFHGYTERTGQVNKAGIYWNNSLVTIYYDGNRIKLAREHSETSKLVVKEVVLTQKTIMRIAIKKLLDAIEYVVMNSGGVSKRADRVYIGTEFRRVRNYTYG